MPTEIVDVHENVGYSNTMLTSEQSRAARGWLNWSQEDLAKRANVSLSTIRDFEKGRRTPIANNLEAIRRAMAAAGVEFVFRDGKPTGIALAVEPANGNKAA